MQWWLVLGAAAAAIAVGAWAAADERRGLAHGSAAAAYGLLALWVVGQADGELGLLLGFLVAGLVVLAAGELAAGWGSAALAARAPAATPLAAVLLALGLDFLRPDATAYVPAAVLAVLVLAVAAQASRRLATAKVGRRNPSPAQVQWRNLYIVCIGVLLYAGLYKTVAIGWPMLYAYAAAAGALLFAVAQLWWGWSVVLRKQLAAPWLRRLALQAGVLLMVVAAFWVYSLPA
ncbi:MAG: hypothetical protein KF698_03285 [Anaerolineales bacterium]|nr:hypothetical protein [Anaerolineales bacterium]